MTKIRFAAYLAIALSLAIGPAWQGALAAPAPDHRPQMIPHGLTLGAYDPHGDFTNDPDDTIEHLFLPWEDLDLASLSGADQYAQEHHRTLLITIEPWTWSQKKHITPSELLNGIRAGKYDGNIAAICNVLRNFQTPTTIRWAQEMEDTTGRFIWSNWRPADYIFAYRKFVSECRAIAPNLAYMWSPRGLPDMNKYYPGDDVVDTIGLSVFALQAYDRKIIGHDRTFVDLLKPGYTLAAKFGKPIYVAELGYRGDADYVHKWETTVLVRRPQFPLLKGVIYFNDKDVIEWPYHLGVPNWQVTENVTASPLSP
jgi:beta-mannanase